MTPASDQHLDALDGALRRSVAQHAAVAIARAHDDADTRIARARAEAAALERRARADGEAAADAVSARARAARRRASSATVLEAEQAVLSELRDQVHEAVLHLRDAPDYPRLLDGLTARAHARLGRGAHVTRDPDGLGGIVAEHDGRRLDYTLPALADRALAELGPAIEDLWK